MSPRSAGLVALVLLGLLSPRAEAAPVAVRMPEGFTRGFLAIFSAKGQAIAHGELVQAPKGERIESRLTFWFKDGSLYDETVTFSQTKVFQLLSYRLVQRGPAFPQGSEEVAFDARTGRYKVRHRPRPGAVVETVEGDVEVPADAHNGMTSVLLKNLPPGASGSGHLLAFTPKPRLVKTELIPAAEETFQVGPTARKATRYLVKLELGGLTGVVATIAGKEPPDLHYWIARGDAPTFVKFEGAFFLNGPTWRVELSPPRLPK